MGILSLVGLLAGIIGSLKNSSGQPLVGSTIGGIITSAQGVITSIVADLQAAGTSGAASGTALTAYLQTIQAIITALASEKVLSAQTVSEISALSTALAAAIAAEQASLVTTNPDLLTPIATAQ